MVTVPCPARDGHGRWNDPVVGSCIGIWCQDGIRHDLTGAYTLVNGATIESGEFGRPARDGGNAGRATGSRFRHRP